MTTGCYTGSGTSKGNCRGADSVAEYARQRDKIVASLKIIDADIVGLMEIQNGLPENADKPVAELVPLFSEDGHHHIPSIDHDRRLVGIITQTDLVRALYRATTGAQPVLRSASPAQVSP